MISLGKAALGLCVLACLANHALATYKKPVYTKPKPKPVVVVPKKPIPVVKKCDDFYHWKDFTGKIPKDAICFYTGSGKLKKLAYLGQALSSKGDIVPAILYENDKKAYCTDSNKKVIYDNVNTKILCASDKSKLLWKNANIDKLDPKCKYVNAGYEKKSSLCFGKVTYKNSDFVGKIYPKTSIFKGLEVDLDVGFYLKKADFQILSCCE